LAFYALPTGAVLLASAASPAFAQADADPIVVTGQRVYPFGITPERMLDEDYISGYGLGTVGELLEEITTENGDSGEEPVILVNGEPVAGLGEIEDYPPEAVEEVQILPRGSGTRVGASPDRRVYNIVLKRSSDIVAARAGYRVATEGGFTAGRGDLSYTNIRGSRRINGALRLRDESALTEAERDVIQPAGSPADLGRFRTLVPTNDNVRASLTVADKLASWLKGSAAAKLSGTRRDGLLGLSSDDRALHQRSRTLTGNAEFSLNATPGDWLISLLGNYDYDRRRTFNERASGESRTRATATTAALDLSASGPILDLPAGSLLLTLGANLSRDALDGRYERNLLVTRESYTQWTRSATGGFEIPLASAANEFLPALGELTATVEFTTTHVTDIGSFGNQTYSLVWRPADWLRLLGSITTGRTPPSVELLSDPILETSGVRYFDPLLDETVDVTQISGGNPELGASRAANRRLSATIKPLAKVPLQLTLDYSEFRNQDLITALPPASDLILLAFPERFVRNPATGALTIVDVRPVQFAREDRKEFRYGLNLSLPLGGGPVEGGLPDESDPPRAFDLPPDFPGRDRDGDPDPAPGEGRWSGRDEAGGGRGGRGGFGRRGGGGPRLQFNLTHRIALESELLIQDGLEPIDLLSRNAIGLGGATRPRHQLDFSMGYAERGRGIRLTGQHKSESFLRLTGGADDQVLRFSPLTTLNLRAFTELGRYAPSVDWLKGARLSLSLNNILNRRQKVRDEGGVTPLAYQRAYRDPIGRTVEVEIRKTF
jgi:hypothetical protein